MTLTTVTLILAGLGAVWTGVLSVMFLRNPETGLHHTTHRLEQLPQVMTDRYISLTVLALAATWYGDLKVIAVLFGTFAFMGFADAFIYARAGHPVGKHLAAGISATLVVVVALLALRTGVSA